MQQSLGDFKHLIHSFPEVNQGNYSDEDVCALNNWGIEVCTTYDLLAAALSTTKEPAGWVAVSERLPERIGGYLCQCSDGNQMVCTVNVVGDWTVYPGGRYYGDLAASDDYGTGPAEVTHWMPLPTPPTAPTPSHA